MGGEWKREDGVPEAPLSTLHSAISAPQPLSPLLSPRPSAPSAISAFCFPAFEGGAAWQIVFSSVFIRGSVLSSRLEEAVQPRMGTDGHG